MQRVFRKVGHWALNRLGYHLVSTHHAAAAALADPSAAAIIAAVRPYTMTSDERVHAVIDAIRYIEASSLDGDIVECGVWRGGSMMAAAQTLLMLGSNSRRLHMFDTFEGMPPPTDLDRDLSGRAASSLLEDKNALVQAYSPIEEVKNNMHKTKYPMDKISLVKGLVEETIPEHAPEKISLLRLDTDWYESTKHELIHLFPRLVKGGILIIDDYGHWQGARGAVDEFFNETNTRIFLSRIDYSGRIGVKN